MYSKNAGYVNIEPQTCAGSYTLILPAMEGTVSAFKSLYTNDSGSTGTITLSETVANFTYLEIYYAKDTSYGYNCVKIMAPNGKRATLINNHYIGGSKIMQTLSRTVAISGTTISAVANMTGYGNMEESTHQSYAGAETAIKIFKVLGYNRS